MRTLSDPKDGLCRPHCYLVPIRLDGYYNTDVQGAVLSLLVQLSRRANSWGPLTLDEISARVAELSRNQSRRNPFRSLPYRVMLKGLDGLHLNELLSEEEEDDKPFGVRYRPTEEFYRSIEPFHIADPFRHTP